MLNHSFNEEIFPNIQAEPPLAQVEAVCSHLIEECLKPSDFMVQTLPRAGYGHTGCCWEGRKSKARSRSSGLAHGPLSNSCSPRSGVNPSHLLN